MYSQTLPQTGVVGTTALLCTASEIATISLFSVLLLYSSYRFVRLVVKERRR